MPFQLSHSESYLKRILVQDFIGIVPGGNSIKYGWHQFPKEFDVADTIYFSWFKNDETGKCKIRLSNISKLISWFPLELILLRSEK